MESQILEEFMIKDLANMVSEYSSYKSPFVKELVYKTRDIRKTLDNGDWGGLKAWTLGHGITNALKFHHTREYCSHNFWNINDKHRLPITTLSKSANSFTWKSM